MIRMEDVLLRVGTIVKAQIGEDIDTILITGKRQVKKYKNDYIDGYSYKAWDYTGVHFPLGIGENAYHFNHPDIIKLVHVLSDDLYKEG
jgi:hypothetical protein